MTATLIFALFAISFSFLNASEWIIEEETSATVLIGVGYQHQGTGTIAAATDNGKGAFVETWNGKKWTSTRKGDIQAGLLMSASISNDSNLQVVTSLLPIYILDKSINDTWIQAANVGGTSQSASVFGKDAIGVVGTLFVGKKTISGVAVTFDRGANWEGYDVPAGYARYGSFVDSNNWFVSSGIWGLEDSSASVYVEWPKALGTFKLSKRFVYGGKGTSSLGQGNTNANGWLAVVSRTSDGGKTWYEVFRSPEGSLYYFNAISCSGSSQCVVVGEGDSDSGGYLTIAFTTLDGGKTWTQSFYSTELFSLMTVVMTSESTGWLAGVIYSRAGMTGQFYYTTNSGLKWNLNQTLSNCMPASLDGYSDSAVGACISSSGSSAAVARYA